MLTIALTSAEIISLLIGLFLTLMVFSYLIGDNVLFRIAVYLFIGVASGYAAAVVVQYVLKPKLLDPIPSLLNDPLQLASLMIIVPFVLSLSLFAKLLPRISWMGSFAMALLVGVGAATAVGGAVVGTLIPQVRASAGAFDIQALGGLPKAIPGLVEGTVMLLGTVLTLAYFQFTAKRAADGSAKRNAILEFMAWLGRIFIAITFGVLFAGVYMAALTAMIERLSSMINFIKLVLGL
ncbi:MAG: hypothetical protein IPP66_11760 [Anaerolineales bacterium]|nr:hypothetical protein [Anaerolineales bacterium]